jgi:plasmid stability protein
MPTLYIRDMPTSTYRKLKFRARRHRRSLTQEAATILEKALEEPEKETDIWAEMDAIKEGIYTRLGWLGDSAPLIREDRER